MGVAFAVQGVFPFGDRQIMVTDFWHQYYPFLSDLWHKLREGSSLLWSWRSGAGINYLGLFSYYLASPLNFLIAIFPHGWLREVVTVILLVKIGFAGLFFALYIRYVFKRYDATLAAFSMFYALCAYTLGYYWNIMWFDVFALLPLVVLGIHALVREGRWRLYTVALAFSVLMNYYIGLFTCIFTALAFIVLCIIEKVSLKDFWRKLLLIAGCSALGIGITAVLTVPAFLALGKSYSAVNRFPTTLRFYESFVDILGNFIAFTPPTSIEGLPNLFCGMLSALLFGAFIRSGKIPLRKKIACSALVAFLLVSCNFNVLSYIWHGFHVPNMLPYRFSFLMPFTMAAVAYYCYTVVADEINRWDLLAMGISGAVFLGLAVFGTQKWEHIISSAAVCAAYIGLFTVRYFMQKKLAGKISLIDKQPVAEKQKQARRKKKKKTAAELAQSQKRVFVLVLLLIVVAEFSVNTVLGVAATRTSTRSNYPERHEDVQTILDMRSTDDVAFYRTEAVNWQTSNDPAILSYDGISVFSSSINVSNTEYMLGLGMYAGQSGNRYLYMHSTPLGHALMNVKYLINRESRDGKAIKDPYFEVAGSSGDVHLLENKYYLPLGFMVREELAGYERINNDPFRNQNEIFKLATGLDSNLLAKIDIVHVRYDNYDVTRSSIGNYSYTIKEGETSGSLKWNYEVPSDGPLYVFTNIDKSDSLRILLFEEEQMSRRSVYPSVFYAGTYSKGDIVSVITDMDAERGRAIIYVAQINHDLFERGYKLLADETLILTEFSDTYIKGTITALESGLMYTSIPYEKGWRAFVDGVETEIITIGGSMAAIRLDAGEHEVEFRYLPDGFALGAIVSATSLAIFAGLIALVFMRKRIIELFLKYRELVMYIIIGGCTTVLGYVAYVFFSRVLGMHWAAANIIAWIIAIVFSYIANRLWVFQSKNKGILKEFVTFTLSRIFALLLDYGFMFIGVELLRFNDLIVKIAVSVLVVICNYVTSKWIVYRK